MHRPYALLLAALSACAGAERTPRPTPSADAGVADAAPADAAEPVFTVLEALTDDAGVRSVRYRLQRGEGAASYALWYPPPADAGPAPVMVLTQPYDGIDWTGEAVDARWATRGAGLHPDEDGPGYDPATGSSIVYEPMSADKAAESTFIWRHNGFGVLMLFGRFYAGGDVANDIEDMTLGFDFLATRDDVDRARVGIFGGSWGGFVALYGAAYAREDLRPTVGVALYPLSDFEAERRYVTEELPQRYTEETSRVATAEFFEPYLRRLDTTIVNRGGFEGLRAEDLVARIDAPFLIVHEDWDTLVSMAQSERLVALAPDRFLPLWILHDGPPDPWDQTLNTHGPLLADFGALGIYPAIFGHLLTHLGGPSQDLLLPWDTASFRALLALMRQRQLEGVDVSFLAPRLAPLCDPRITAYAVDTQASATGAEMVAAELGLAWGVPISADAACEALRAGQLPAP